MPWFCHPESGGETPLFVHDVDLEDFSRSSDGALCVEIEPPRCSICKQPQIDTDSGITCPNGHGGAPSVLPFQPRRDWSSETAPAPAKPRRRIVLAEEVDEVSHQTHYLILEPSQVQDCWRCAVLDSDPATAPLGAGRLITEGTAVSCLQYASGELLSWASPQAAQDLDQALEAWRILLAQAHRALDVPTK